MVQFFSGAKKSIHHLGCMHRGTTHSYSSAYIHPHCVRHEGRINKMRNLLRFSHVQYKGNKSGLCPNCRKCGRINVISDQGKHLSYMDTIFLYAVCSSYHDYRHKSFSINNAQLPCINKRDGSFVFFILYCFPAIMLLFVEVSFTSQFLRFNSEE